jgi:hypothetical protein
MKLAIATLLHIAVYATLPDAKLGDRDYNPATAGVSDSLTTRVSFVCTLLQQILDAETLFPGTANCMTENTGN